MRSFRTINKEAEYHKESQRYQKNFKKTQRLKESIKIESDER